MGRISHNFYWPLISIFRLFCVSNNPYLTFAGGRTIVIKFHPVVAERNRLAHLVIFAEPGGVTLTVNAKVSLAFLALQLITNSCEPLFQTARPSLALCRHERRGVSSRRQSVIAEVK